MVATLSSGGLRINRTRAGCLATGSHNFSANAQKNAENQLYFTNARLRDLDRRYRPPASAFR